MPLIIEPDDSRLSWYGAVSFQRGDGWLRPWRIPFDDRILFGRLSEPEPILSRAAMGAGVRIAFHSNTTVVVGEIEPLEPDEFEARAQRGSAVDIACNGRVAMSMPLAEDAKSFGFLGLPPEEKLIEVWLPHYRETRLRRLRLSDGASISPYEDRRPRWVVHGSSYTQSMGAKSPTGTWPAVVAHKLDLNHTNLGFGGQCHLDSMVARLIRDLPADAITLEVGINIFGQNTLNPRSFRAALVGFIATVREKHQTTPISVISPLYSEARDGKTNEVGFTLAIIRDTIAAIVGDLKSHGDATISYVNGMDLLGPQHAHLFPDGLHPNAEGYQLLGETLAERYLKQGFIVAT